MIAGLISACRAAGLRISTAETLDGVQAAAQLGWQDKRKLKSALSIALAKTAEDKKAFSKCFDRYFEITPPRAPARTKRNGEARRRSKKLMRKWSR